MSQFPVDSTAKMSQFLRRSQRPEPIRDA